MFGFRLFREYLGCNFYDATEDCVFSYPNDLGIG